MKRITISFFLSFLFICAPGAKLSMPKFFSNHMVLQRDMPVKIWGKADKGETVTVAFNHQTLTAKAGKNGNWSVEFPSMQAGGPYEMKIAGKSGVIEFRDILIGDVWICSGQSNMEWPLAKTDGADAEIRNSTNRQIRLITVQKTIQLEEQYDIPEGTWEVCTPDISKDFSAVGYYFGKELQQELNVPIGLIHASWGGTNIQPWTSWETMVTTGDYKKYAGKTVKQSFSYDPKNWNRYTKALEQERDLKEKWYLPETASDGWKQMDVPKMWDGELASADGIVWFRKEIELPESAAGKSATLRLAAIDDEDKTYVNGKLVGETASYDAPRNYRIESGILREGKNTIIVRIKDNHAGGGIYGSPEDVYLETEGKKYDLAGAWEYKPSVITTQYNAIPLGPNSFPSLLYNGMIKPLVGYGIKGAIWYQGENNAHEAYKYRTLFPDMIKDWRKQWGYEFPFFWVQLANFMKVQDQPGESAWAELREAQSMTLSLPETGQAVITDIGDANDIHPRNKKDVGHRLALNALKVAYGKELTASGPVYDSMQKEGDRILLTFKDTGTGLKPKDGNKYGYVKGFTIAGADKKFVWAKAYISGNKVVVFSEQISDPVAVRYAWADNPDDNDLANSAGLLASPFRTDNWKGITE